MTKARGICGTCGQRWSLLIKLVTLCLLSIELTESRIPTFERRNSIAQIGKSKKIRGGLNNSRPPSPLILPMAEPLPIADIDVNGEVLDVEKRQWLELDSVPPARVSAKLHSEVILECVAVGSPPPIISWLKDGKRIESLPFFDSDELLNGVDAQMHSGFSMSKIKTKLPIRCIRPEDEGEYTCVATQIDGPAGTGPRSLKSSAMVIIDEDDESEAWKPECEFRLPPFVFNGKKGRRGTPAYIHAAESLHMEIIGNSIYLPCRAGGKPKPRIQWFGSNGLPIVRGKKYQINTKGDLVIRDLSWTEMGDYTCHVENSYGAESTSTFLYPLLSEDR